MSADYDPAVIGVAGYFGLSEYFDPSETYENLVLKAQSHLGRSLNMQERSDLLNLLEYRRDKFRNSIGFPVDNQNSMAIGDDQFTFETAEKLGPIPIGTSMDEQLKHFDEHIQECGRVPRASKNISEQSIHLRSPDEVNEHLRNHDDIFVARFTNDPDTAVVTINDITAKELLVLVSTEIQSGNLLDVPTAATEAGVTPDSIRKAIAGGKLIAVKLGKTNWITIEDLEASGIGRFSRKGDL